MVSGNYPLSLTYLYNPRTGSRNLPPGERGGPRPGVSGWAYGTNL